MERADSLKPLDNVTVAIFGPDNSCLYKQTSNGYHNLEEAINAAIDEANLNVSPEDCVFEVSNETKDVTHRYRLNAHGHLKLII